MKLFVKAFYFLIIIIHCWSIGLHNGDAKWCCPETDGDEPAGNWLAPHGCVHGVLVNKKTNTIFMSVLFATVVMLLHKSFELFTNFLNNGLKALKSQKEKISM